MTYRKQVPVIRRPGVRAVVALWLALGGAARAADRCGAGQACAADQFCAPSGRCVSAVVAVTAGAGHTCAAHRDGRISCWGYADAVKGKGGAVVGPTEIAGIAHPLALAAGQHETCAVIAGQVQCFGLDDFTLRGEDGQPLTGATAVTLGTGFGCALNAAGVHCWGRNESGQLARPSTTAGSPNAVLAFPGARRLLGAGLGVVVADDRQICAWGNNATHLIPSPAPAGPVMVPVCTPVRDIAGLTVGAAHACVRHGAGGFSCWGERYYGQLGSGPGKDKADLVAPGKLVTLGGRVLALAAGAGHTCALLEGGRVFCFGLNGKGQVGEGADQIYVPRQRTGLRGPAVAIGSGPTARHTCAVLRDGSVDCWGNDDAGQLGGAPRSLDPARSSRRPVRVGF
jgi:alpha-tubulin suppressor-like RCC1 family protein